MSDRPASTDTSGFYCEIGGLPARIVPTDLTKAGVFVQTTAPPDADSEVEIFLRSAAGTITVQAHVVHVVDAARAAKEQRSPGFGALFTHLSEEARAWIERTLAGVGAPVVSLAPPRAANEGAQTAAHIAPAPQAPDPRILATLAELERTLRDLRVRPAWDVLGIERDATPEVAREAYLEASRRYHPHRFARYGSAALAKVATELFIAHQQAYRALSRTSKERVRPERPASTPRIDDPHSRETVDFPLAGALDASTNVPRGRPDTPRPAVIERIDTRTPRRSVPAPHIIDRLSTRTPARSVPAPSIADRIVTRTPADSIPAPSVNRVPTRTPAHSVPAPSANHVPRRTPAHLVPAPSAGRVPTRTPPHSIPAPTHAGPATRANRRPTPLPDEVDEVPDSERPTRETLDRRVAEGELAVAAGLKHLALGRLPEATATFGQALAFDAANEQAHLWLLVCQARALKAEGKEDLARSRYEAVLALDPKHREAMRETGATQERPTLRRKRRWFGGGSKE